MVAHRRRGEARHAGGVRAHTGRRAVLRTRVVANPPVVDRRRVIAAAGGDLPREPGARRGSQLREREEEDGHLHGRRDRHARPGAEGRSDPEPVVDPGVARVERGEHEIHVGEGRQPGEDVRDRPSEGDRRDDGSDRDERVEVPLVDPGRDDEEGDCEDGQADEDRPPVRPASDDQTDGDEGGNRQGRAEDHGRDRPEREGLAAPGERIAVGHDHVADPPPVLGESAALEGDERPRVPGVHRQVRVAAGRLEDLRHEAGQAQPERQGHHDCGQEAREPGRHDPDGAAGRGLPGRRRTPAGRGVLVAVPSPGPERASDRHGRDDRYEDAELWLRDRRDDREDRSALRTVAPELPEAQEEEDQAERIDLPPDRAVQPGDRVDRDDERTEAGGPAPGAELASHRPDQVAEDDVRDHRRDLDEVSDPTEQLPDRPDDPQDVEVTGRVIVEEVPRVEAVQAFASEVRGPEPEGADVVGKAGARQEVCDDDAEDEGQREEDEDAADVVTRPGARRASAPNGLTRHGACQPVRPPARAMRWRAG